MVFVGGRWGSIWKGVVLVRKVRDDLYMGNVLIG